MEKLPGKIIYNKAETIKHGYYDYEEVEEWTECEISPQVHYNKTTVLMCKILRFQAGNTNYEKVTLRQKVDSHHQEIKKEIKKNISKAKFHEYTSQ